MKVVSYAEEDLAKVRDSHFLVVGESASERIPEMHKLISGGGNWIRSVANDAAGSGLLRRIIVPHVVVRVENSIGTWSSPLGCG